MESLSSLGNESNLVGMTTVTWTTELPNNVSTFETTLTGTGCHNSSEWESYSTELAPIPPPSNQEIVIPVVGYPGPIFTAIHTAALTSLSLSTVTVTLLLIYLCGISGSVKEHTKGTVAHGKTPAQQKKKARLPFWRWNVGERFVVYLGACDLLQGISHFLDHAYMFYAKANPPDRVCAVFAFFLHEFVFAQFFVIVTTAVSACSLIVFGRKMSLGRRDWKLFAFGFGIPTVVSVVAASRGLLGASGAWCFIKYGAPSWLLYTQFVNTFQITSFGLVGVAYGAIWIKIQRTTKLMKGSTTERYQSSAKVMMIFVAVFILQWWTLTLFNIWGLFAPPPPPVLILAVIFINLGGIYNSVAYTIIRRKLQQQKRQNAVSSNVDKVTNSTAASSSGGVKPSRTISSPRALPAPRKSRSPADEDFSPDVLRHSPNFPDDSGVDSRVSEAWSVPIIQESVPDEKQDAGQFQIHVYM